MRKGNILAAALLFVTASIAGTSGAEARYYTPLPPRPDVLYGNLLPRPWSDPQYMRNGLDYSPLVERKRELYAKAHDDTITEEEKEELEKITSILIQAGIYT